MIRICPHSDSMCAHGMNCPFSCATSDYNGTKTERSPTPIEALIADLRRRLTGNGDFNPDTIFPLFKDCADRLESLTAEVATLKADNARSHETIGIRDAQLARIEGVLDRALEKLAQAHAAQPWRPNREAVAKLICERCIGKNIYAGAPPEGVPNEIDLAYADAILALAPAEGEGGWRGIESAPRDGKRILVSNSRAVWEDYRVMPGRRSSDGMPLDGRDFQHAGHYGRPTHWQSLPEPPKGQDK